MKFFLFAAIFLGSLQLIYAETEKDIVHKERWGECIIPRLDSYFIESSKVDGCPRGKPFGTKISIAFENDDDYFSYVVNICRKKHKPQLPKKIFNCAERRAVKQCKFLGLPDCVTDSELLYGRWEILDECLQRVLRKCSNGEVSTY